jgi:hypothetical protein
MLLLASRSMNNAPPTNGKGPHSLTLEKIAEVVAGTSPGNYTLGYVRENGFCIRYVGRADDDVAKQLRSWARQHPHYRAFAFSYAPSSRAAFDKECEDFHDFGGTENLDNVDHPKRPDTTDWLCPRCNFYD